MSGHTKGPWKVDGAWGLIVGPNGEEVAAIHAAEVEGSKRLMPKTAYGNALLIAAAPELLEAAEYLLRLYEKIYEDRLDEEEWEPLRAAIAKAKGDGK